MNIDQALDHAINKGTVEISAGGPGSGRKPSATPASKVNHAMLKQAGFKYRGTDVHGYRENNESFYEHPKHGFVTSYAGNRWSAAPNVGKSVDDKGGSVSLQSYLSTLK